MTDLSKALDCLPLDLFLAKLQADGFDNKSLALAENIFKIGNKGLKLKLDRNLVHG